MELLLSSEAVPVNGFELGCSTVNITSPRGMRMPRCAIVRGMLTLRQALSPGCGQRRGIRLRCIEHAPNLVTVEHGQQAREMVAIGMGQHDEIEAAIPKRHHCAQFAEERRGIRAAVDQDLPAIGGLHQDRVALPHVEEVDVEPAIRQFPQRQPGNDRQECQHAQQTPTGEPSSQRCEHSLHSLD